MNEAEGPRKFHPFPNLTNALNNRTSHVVKMHPTFSNGRAACRTA
jgi:hypothetical protein